MADLASAFSTIDNRPSPVVRSTPKSQRELDGLKIEATKLLEKFAPDEAEHAGLLLAEFKGKEEDLIEQLQDLAERAILASDKEQRMAQAKKKGRRQAKVTRGRALTPTLLATSSAPVPAIPAVLSPPSSSPPSSGTESEPEVSLCEPRSGRCQ